MAALIQATLTPIIAPLVAEQVALRQTVERQAERLEAQAETIGRQGAELEAERERGKSFHVELECAQAERDAAESSRRREHRRLSIALAVVIMLGIVAALAPS